MAPHDLEQAGVVGQAERFGRPRDVPVVLFQRLDDDAPFGLGFERLEGAGRRVGIGAVVVAVTAYLRRHLCRRDGVALRGDDHPLEAVAELADVVPGPAVLGRASPAPREKWSSDGSGAVR